MAIWLPTGCPSGAARTPARLNPHHRRCRYIRFVLPFFVTPVISIIEPSCA